jgi:hypothetical protein
MYTIACGLYSPYLRGPNVSQEATLDETNGGFNYHYLEYIVHVSHHV